MRLVIATLGVFLLPAALIAAGEHTGRRAPGFALQDANGRMHDLQDYRGKVVLLDIMKTECPHCRVFSQILEQVQAKYGERVKVLSIVHPPDTTATVRGYVAENKVTSPVLFDCGQVAYSYIMPKNPAISLPQLFVIGGDGVIKNNFAYGLETKDIFEGKGLFGVIEKTLAGAPPKR